MSVRASRSSWRLVSCARLSPLVPLLLALTGCAEAAVSTSPPPAPVSPPPASAAPSAASTPRATVADANAPVAAGPVPGETKEQRAARIHRQAIIVDGHNDIPMVMYGTGYDLAKPNPNTHSDLARFKSGGMTGEFFSIYVDNDTATKPTPRGGGALRRALDLIDVTYQQVERHPNDLLLATTAADIRRAKREGKLAVLMGIESGYAIESSLFALRELFRLGCRYMTLTHTIANEWADSAGSGTAAPVRHHGLSPFGEDVVREMQRIGMVVDISHTSDETFAAVMKIAKAPVIASHSSSRALGAHRRDMSDDMLKALGKNGGVAMVNFWSMFLSPAFATESTKWQERNAKLVADIRARHRGDYPAMRADLDALRAKDPLPKVPLSVLVDHIDHMVKVAGVDHVGLGSDFDGCDALPEGITGVGDLPKITLALVERGYSDEDILKILGGNFLRVFEATEAYAKSTNTTLSGDGNTRKID